MTSFATLQHALDARAQSTAHAVHYIAARRTTSARVDYALLRERALRLLGHFQQRGVAPAPR